MPVVKVWRRLACFAGVNKSGGGANVAAVGRLVDCHGRDSTGSLLVRHGSERVRWARKKWMGAKEMDGRKKWMGGNEGFGEGGYGEHWKRSL